MARKDAHDVAGGRAPEFPVVGTIGCEGSLSDQVRFIRHGWEAKLACLYDDEFPLRVDHRVADQVGVGTQAGPVIRFGSALGILSALHTR